MTVAIAARVARPLTRISPLSSEIQQQRAEGVIDRILSVSFAVVAVFVVPSHLVLLVWSLRPDCLTLILLAIAGVELGLTVAWFALMFLPWYSHVVRHRVQSVTGRKVSVVTRWTVRTRMVCAVAPPALAGWTGACCSSVDPNVSHGDLLARVVVMKAVIFGFLCLAAPLFARSVTLPIRELTDGAGRLKHAGLRHAGARTRVRRIRRTCPDS